MKNAFVMVAILLAPLFAAAQTTTYTTTETRCGGKATQYCGPIPVLDQSGKVNSITIDNRGGIGNLYVGDFTAANQISGQYSGFVGNPDGTRTPFYGVASFKSNDGTATGSLQFYAYYVATCSGRACGGTIGWHYQILLGSVVQIGLTSQAPSKPAVK